MADVLAGRTRTLRLVPSIDPDGSCGCPSDHVPAASADQSPPAVCGGSGPRAAGWLTVVKPSAIAAPSATDCSGSGGTPISFAFGAHFCLGASLARSEAVLQRLRPAGVVVVPLATLEALAELRPLLETAGLQVAIRQLQVWRGAPLGDGTRLAPLNPVLVLSGRRS